MGTVSNLCVWEKEIENHYSLDDETAPEMRGKNLVGAGEAGNEVFLEGFDGYFSSVAAVAVG